MNSALEITAFDNQEVAAMLKRANAFLPYRPMFCLKELKRLKNAKLLMTANDRAKCHLIEGKALLEVDDLNKAFNYFKKGLKIVDETDGVLVLELEMHRAYISGIKKKKKIDFYKKELLSVGNQFKELEEIDLAAKADLFYGILLVSNREYVKALSTLKKIYLNAIEHKLSLIEAKACNQIVEVYSLLGNLNTVEAERWTERLFEKNEELGLQKGAIISTIQLAKLQASRGENAESRLSFHFALKLLEESRIDYKMLNLEVLNQLSHSYLIQGMENPVKSYEYSCRAMELAEDLEDYYPGIPHILLGMTKLISNEEVRSIPYSPIMNEKWVEEQIQLAEENIDENDLIGNKALWKACFNYYRHKGDTEKAFYYMDKFMESTERLSDNEKTTTISLLEQKTQEQEEEIEEMEKELEDKEVLEELNELLEKTVNKRTANLTVKNNELKEYAYIVAHDLKEPIRTLVEFTKVLEERVSEYGNAEDIEIAGYIKDSGIRMHELIEGLLKYSTLNLEENDLSITNFNKLVKLIVADIQYSIQESNAIIEVSKLPEELLVNRLMIKQVFQNLISNAIKFRKKGQKSIVKINCEARMKDYLFSIEDNGIGIDENYHKIVFKLFNRLHKSKGYKGTGIGLSICKKTIELHGGEIWLESEVGEGTTFFFTLPKKVNILS